MSEETKEFGVKLLVSVGADASSKLSYSEQLQAIEDALQDMLDYAMGHQHQGGVPADAEVYINFSKVDRTFIVEKGQFTSNS